MPENIKKEKNDSSTHISNEMLVVWYQALLNRFNTLNSANNSIDNKTSIILAAAVAVMIFGASATQNFSFLRITGLLFVTLSVVLSLINIGLREAPSEINSTEDRPDYYHKDNSDFIWQLIADLEQSIELHEIVNRKKALLYKWLAGIFAIASIVLLMSNYVELNLIIVK